MKIANMPIPSDTIFTCKTNWKRLAVHAWKSGSVRIHGGAKVATSWDSMCQPLQGHPWELHVRLLTGDWLHGVSQKGLLSIGQNLNPKFHQTLGEFCCADPWQRTLVIFNPLMWRACWNMPAAFYPLNPGISWLSLKASGVDILRALWNSR